MNLEQLIALGLDEEKAKAALALHDEDVNGLKSKNTELLGKFESYKTELSTKEQTIEEARQAAVKAQEEKLLAEGKYKEAQELREKERAELVAKANEEAEKARNMLKQRDLQEVHSDIMRGVHDNFTPAAQALLAANTEVTYGEDGTKKVTIRHGDKEFNNTADFKEFAKTDPTWSAMLKAPDTKGVGATTSSQAASNDPDAAFKQRVKEALNRQRKHYVFSKYAGV